MEGDRSAEAQPDERMSQTKVKSRMYASILPTERHPVAKRVMIAEAETDAPKPLRGTPDGTGYRDMARSESSAQELGRPADGKPTAGVGGVRSSVEAGNDRGAKGLCPKGVSKESGAERLRKRHLTEREIREIGAKRHLTKYPDLALMTERLARKAEAEPKSRFHNLYRWVLHDETMRCAWERVKANGISAERSSLRGAKSLERCAPGVDGITFQMIERGEGGAEGFIKGIQKELHEKTYRASPLRRKYIEKANGKMRPLGISTTEASGGIGLNSRTHTTVNSTTTACTGSDGRMSAGGGIDRKKSV